MNGESWISFAEDEELVCIAVDRDTYARLRAHGKPSAIIADIISGHLDDKPVFRRMLMNTSVDVVSVSVIVNEYVAAALKGFSSDHVFGLILNWLDEQEPVIVDPGYRDIGIDI
jgi:hypothetical protein